MNKRFGNTIFKFLFAVLLLMNGAAMAQRTDTPSSVTVGGNVFGGGNEAMVGGNCTVIINQGHATITHDVYGGGALAKVNTTDGTTLTTGKSTNVTLMRGIVKGDLYGGGLGDNTSGSEVAADVFGPVTVTIKGGTVRGSVFGCNNLYGAPKSTVTVNVVNDLSGVTMTLHNVYGGGNLADYEAPAATIQYPQLHNYPEVNIKHGTVGGSVFGGGLGATATVTGNPQVTIGDDVAGHTAIVNNNNVYGGGDLAAVTGSTTVTVQNANSQVGIDVYGGGNQADVSGSTTVNINNGTIGQDVYGGGAFAHVGTDGNDNTTVNVLGGTVIRDIYGGGLGQTAVDDNPETPDDDESLPDIVALVNGVVHVNIGTVNNTDPENPVYSGAATIGGCVFGCNNINGTPKNNVFVDVYGTAHTSANTYPNPEPTLEQLLIPAADNAYAIKAVYGGGNKAAYAPVDNDKTAQVHVYSCVNTIQTVYGGGNAANATKVHTIIDGGRFDRVFGGGNGYSETGNHDDPGLPNYNPGANVTVSATTEIHGGLFRQVFGGSNQYGDVANASLAIDSQSGCSELIGEAFGGANEANITGNVTTTLGCSNVRYGNFYGGSNLADITGNVTLNVNGGTYTSVFGGSKGRLAQDEVGNPGDSNYQPAVEAKAANITGDVTLNLYGGIMTNAFGGSDVNGNIGGKITVNLDNAENLTCPLVVHNIYGGGRDASYTPNTPGAYPEVNLIKGTVSTYVENEVTKGGYVFGGGLGVTAEVTSNPKVNLQGGVVQTAIFGGGEAAPVTGNPVINANYGTAPTIHGGGWGSTAIVTGNPSVVVNETNGKTLTVTSVYGGGDAAEVQGNTTVQLLAGTVTNAFGGGNVADIDGTTTVTLAGATAASIYGGGNEASVSGTSSVTVSSGNVTAGLYGGCNTSGTVNGAINVYVNGGTVGSSTTHADGVYGGGFGVGTGTGSDVTVTIGNTEGTPEIFGDVYGGSAKGKVNSSEASPANTTKVWLKKGTITGDIYGGGYGLDNAEALVYGNVKVLVSGGTVNSYTSGTTTLGGRVFGCNNVKGTPKGMVDVTIDATNLSTVTGDEKVYALQGVYGGGNLAAYDPTTPYENGETVYPKVTVNGCASSVKDVYGGGNAAPVPNSKVVINGGDIKRVFAGGNGESGTPAHIGWKNTDATPTTEAYGNGQASAEIKGGTIEQVFCGSNANGMIRTSSSVDVNKSTATGACPMKIREVYGGGNFASGNAGTINIGCTGTLTDDHSTHPENIGTTLEGIGYVYGGANQANITSNITLNIISGIVENVFGGNNTSGNISGSIQVNINKNNNASCASNWYVGNVFGGGNQARYDYTPDVNIQNGTVSSNVYGGGNQAGVGGGDVAMTGGSVLGGIYGGCNTSGTVTGGVTVSVSDGIVGTANTANGAIYGGGLGSDTNVQGSVGVTVSGGTINNDVYGGSAKGLVNCTMTGSPATPSQTDQAETTVTLSGGTVNGSLYGGGHGLDNANAHVYGPVQVTVNGGTVANVFGCNNVNGAPQSTVTVDIDETSANTMSVTNVYGGGNQAAYSGTPAVNIINGTVSGNVYGGGNKAGVAGSNVEMTGGVVLTGVYGGCNYSGTVTGSSLVKILGGTVGSTALLNTTTPVVAQVFGGGLGADTRVNGDVTVNINGSGVNIYGDVYGGSALGQVNDAASDKTTVNVLDGVLHSEVKTVGGFPVYYGGNVYGGGLGKKAVPDDPEVEGDQSESPIEAMVNGTVTVNIGKISGTGATGGDQTGNYYEGNATIQGNVYGCNNTNGSPQEDVTVNIYQTAHTTTDDVDYVEDDGVNGPPTFAINNVFGGGNEADFRVNKTTTVNVFGCDNTIRRTFGGGNAAATNSVITDIKGGRIHDVFGGGNGEVSAADIYGSITLGIHGGTIGQSYSISNQNGVVTEGASVVINNTGCGGVDVEEHFMGGNFANVYGDLNSEITCEGGMIVKNLYGGCKQAHVLKYPSAADVAAHLGDGTYPDYVIALYDANPETYGSTYAGTGGNVHLTVKGGTYENVYGGSQGTTTTGANIEGNVQLDIYGGTITNAIYGGSHIKGSIGGTIIVNVEDKFPNDPCALDVSIADVYGGGNQANYPGEGITHDGEYNYPQVNIKNAMVKNVFGGALEAEVTGNPQIQLKNKAIILGNVYGGGNRGVVNGNPKVILNGKQTN